MRTLPASAEVQYGSVPYHELRVSWVDGAELSYISQIISIGTVDNVIQISNNSDSQSVDISLDDTDGYIRSLMDTIDVHQRPAKLYLRWQGSSDELLLFKGEVSSPIVWREGSREVRLTILSKIEEAEVGFSAEQGNFTTIPESVVGKAWPISFGTVCRMQPLRLTEKITGTTLDTFGIPDPTLPVKIDMKIERAYPIASSGVVLPWTSSDDIQSYCGEIQEMSLEHLRQYQYAVGQIGVNNGDKFPQNQIVSVKINDEVFRGYFIGNTFYFENGTNSTAYYQNYLAYTALKEAGFYDSETGIVCGSGCAGRCENYQYGAYHVPRHPDGEPTYWADANSVLAFGNGLGHGCSPEATRAKSATTQYDDVTYYIWDGATRSSKTGYVTSRGYWQADAGSTVELVNDAEPIDYVINLIGATDIEVCGNLGGSSSGLKLVGLPYEWYTIVSMPIGPFNATILRLKQPLSTYDSRFSDDEIYVSFTSEVGPNPVVVIKWLLENFSRLNWDIPTFDAVETKLDAYCVGFTLWEKRQLTDLIKDIAYQSRCAIWLVDGVYKIAYLSETPTSIDTISWTDIHVDTFEMSFTSTEELVTKLTATWNDCGDFETKKIVVRNNISKYGLKPQDYNYYIYNDFNCVLKSATFHILRKSNTFRKYSFVASMHKLLLEPFDAVTINGVLAVVEAAVYDPNAFTVSITAWVPIRSGESTQYTFGFPASVSQYTSFGTSPPTSGVSLNAGYGGIDRATNDTGDLYPSDTGDIPCAAPTSLGCLPFSPTGEAGSQQSTTVSGISFDPGGTSEGVNEPDPEEPEDYGCLSESGNDNGLDDALACFASEQGGSYEFIPGQTPAGSWLWSNGETSCSYTAPEDPCTGQRTSGGARMTWDGTGEPTVELV